MHKHVFVIYLLMCSPIWHIWGRGVVWNPEFSVTPFNDKMAPPKTYTHNIAVNTKSPLQTWCLQSAILCSFPKSSDLHSLLTHKMAALDPWAQHCSEMTQHWEVCPGQEIRREHGDVHGARADWVSRGSGQATTGKKKCNYFTLSILWLEFTPGKNNLEIKRG